MDAQQLDRLAQRMDRLEEQTRRLEGQNRRQKRVVITLSIALVAAVAAGTSGTAVAVNSSAEAQVQNEVRAKSFKVVDDQNRVRVVMQYNTNDGASVIDFWDENKSWRGGFSAGPNNSQFVMKDSNDTERYRFQADQNNTYIQITDRAGTKKTTLRPQ